MRNRVIKELEAFLAQHDFGPNWDGAYQDVIPTIRQFFAANGFETHLVPEWDSPSRDAQLIAENNTTVVRIPWVEDTNGRSLVHLQAIQVQQSVP